MPRVRPADKGTPRWLQFCVCSAAGAIGPQKTCPAKYSSHSTPGPAALLLNLDQLHLPLQPMLRKSTWCLSFPKGDGDKECVYSLCAAKPKVRCLFAFISNAVGRKGQDRLPRSAVQGGRRTVAIEFCAFVRACIEKLSVWWIIMDDHKKFCKSRAFSVVMHLIWMLWTFSEWNVNFSERQLAFLEKCGLRLAHQWAFRTNRFLQSNGGSRLAGYCESCNSLHWVLDIPSCSLKWYFYFTLVHYLHLK